MSSVVRDIPDHKGNPRDTSDSNRWRRMKEAMMSFRQPSAFKPFLKSVYLATSARANWLALGILVAVGLFSFWNTASLIEINRSRIQLRMLLVELQGTLSAVKDAETGQRGYLLVGDESYLEPYTKAVQGADQQISRVDELMIALPSQQSTFDTAQRRMALKFAELKKTVQLRQNEGIEAAMRVVRTGQGKKLMDEIRGLMDQISQEIQNQLANYDRRTASLSRRATLWCIFGNVFAAVLFILVIQRERWVRGRVEQQARELAVTVEVSRMQAIAKSKGEVESLGQQARVLADFVQALQDKTHSESDKQIEALGEQARELAALVETSRINTLNQSDRKIAALGQQARTLASSVETSRINTLNQSDKTIAAMGQQARILASSVETSRINTLSESDKEIDALGQKARALARSVETLRIKTFNQSEEKIEALGEQARELATTVESVRIETLNQSNQEIRTLNEGLEQRVVERTSQLEAANKELDSFSYSVSHDLRAPLRAIDGFSRIVLEDYSAPLATEGKVYLQLVRDNTRQMGQLVDDLLAFARLGRLPLTKLLVEPDKIVPQCLEEMMKEREGRQVEIVIGDLPACHADPVLLKQVWTNLLANALKYTRKREIARIEIGCRTQTRLAVNGQPASPEGAGSDSASSGSAGPEVVYFVKDNGTGFDMKYVGKLFGVFQRLHRAADYEGTGVGLAIVQRIVQRHGGRIWADAKFDEGATFSFTLN
jgi:signal transduction histidine kinase